MLQIRDLIWGLLFVGFAGKKLSYLLFILGSAEVISRLVAKAKCKNEGRAVLILEQHPLAGLAGGILAIDSGQWRWVSAGALQIHHDSAKSFCKK